jgi:hypothetical protein
METRGLLHEPTTLAPGRELPVSVPKHRRMERSQSSSEQDNRGQKSASVWGGNEVLVGFQTRKLLYPYNSDMFSDMREIRELRVLANVREKDS